MTELLPQKEIKEKEAAQPIEISTGPIDQDHLQKMINLREKKLESVKPYISLKLYHQIAEKLSKEAALLLNEFKQKKAEVAKQNREQALPKAFFEQKFMKPKNIRID